MDIMNNWSEPNILLIIRQTEKLNVDYSEYSITKPNIWPIIEAKCIFAIIKLL
jgi:hypothetical protein